jgi:hypothetical protein
MEPMEAKQCWIYDSECPHFVELVAVVYRLLGTWLGDRMNNIVVVLVPLGHLVAISTPGQELACFAVAG